jgi:hypothetical protein
LSPFSALIVVGGNGHSVIGRLYFPVFSVDSYGENAGRLLGVAMAKGGVEKGKWILRYWHSCVSPLSVLLFLNGDNRENRVLCREDAGIFMVA